MVMLFDKLIVKQLASHVRYYDAMSERTLTLLVELLLQVLRECFEFAVSEQTLHHNLGTALREHLSKVGNREYAPPEELRARPLPTPIVPPSKGKKNNRSKKNSTDNKTSKAVARGKRNKKSPDLPTKIQTARVPEAHCGDGTTVTSETNAFRKSARHGPANLPVLNAQELEHVSRLFNDEARNLVLQFSTDYFRKSYE